MIGYGRCLLSFLGYCRVIGLATELHLCRRYHSHQIQESGDTDYGSHLVSGGRGNILRNFSQQCVYGLDR